MLATRVIPVLLKRGDALVKGERFKSWRSVGHALQAAKIHAKRQVDELIVLDIAATPEGRGPDFDAISELTKDCFCPITVGGGVRTIDDAKALLRVGADKVAVHTAGQSLVKQIAERCGRQAVVAVIDYYDNWVGVPELARQYEEAGAGEILLQSVERDGTMAGYDIEMIRKVSRAVSIPVIACGGCSGYDDMVSAINAGASAVAAGALFQFTDCTPKGAAEYLDRKGIETRIPI